VRQDRRPGGPGRQRDLDAQPLGQLDLGIVVRGGPAQTVGVQPGNLPQVLFLPQKA
jgi:hypothetical protein